MTLYPLDARETFDGVNNPLPLDADQGFGNTQHSSLIRTGSEPAAWCGDAPNESGDLTYGGGCQDYRG